ncbi:MAG: phosphoribosyltransferase [Candidatus Methanoperedens sp.]|nr:phosphoribosyltransferase [Candidatus Methanoperedens sp.]
MTDIKIKLRKNAFIKTMVLRVVLYTMLLLCSIAALYLLNTFASQYNIKYVIYVLILVPLAFFFQYLIYSFSMEKKISFNNFKDTLMELESADNIRTGVLDHPVKFLFPEFELFYKLEDSVNDKINFQKLGEINYINKEKALQIEKEFKNFISDNLQQFLEYDLVIKMKRKGKAIFDDLIEQFPPLEKLVPFTDPAVIYNMQKIKDRKILIFDDSIHHSNSARNIIDLIKKIGYEKILFLTVVAQKDSLESLKREYPDVVFLQYEIKDEEEYKKFYAEYMIGYLDHVNRSLENDHALIKLKIDTLIKKEDFIDIFEDNRNYIYEVERIVEKENEYKISLECPWIYDKMKNSIFDNIKMDMVKVRFFIKLNQPTDTIGTTDINLSPALIPREFDQDFCNKRKTKDFCLLYKLNILGVNEEINNLVCINCVINNLTSDFINEFMKYFEMKLREKKRANIIEKNISFPFPQELYRGK